MNTVLKQDRPAKLPAMSLTKQQADECLNIPIEELESVFRQVRSSGKAAEATGEKENFRISNGSIPGSLSLFISPNKDDQYFEYPIYGTIGRYMEAKIKETTIICDCCGAVLDIEEQESSLCNSCLNQITGHNCHYCGSAFDEVRTDTGKGMCNVCWEEIKDVCR
jgi:hypothetical protein